MVGTENAKLLAKVEPQRVDVGMRNDIHFAVGGYWLDPP
jgi:hypothetical protein